MKILFISHSYPPIVGGVETQNFELSYWLAKIANVKIIANRRGKKFLPIFMLFALLKSIILLKKYDVVLLGSGLLAHMGWILKIIYNKPVMCIVHGLDITYTNVFYQFFWIHFLTKLDKIVAVGNETAKVAVNKGIRSDRVIFIPNGINIHKYFVDCSQDDLEKIIHLNLNCRHILLTSGRLVKRKGVAWFISNVMPVLPDNIIYVVSGSGPDKNKIEKEVQKKKLFNRVILIGYVTDEVRNILFHTCDLFIQPNIKVPGDIEGFGISVIEAAFCRIPVIVSKLEGLQDAIKDRVNGFLVEPNNIEAWATKILEVLAIPNFRENLGEKSRQFIIDNYRWEKIAQIYLKEIEKMVSQMH